ncbi:hypothetical protein RRG08_005842 [Elysia crispata]|uniref:Ig-like domain-containing protein n=1 Tax=Elysia crispata TaxID=231223 RepID=A0AAE1EB23_9GAST|nr:hypothetical protein RRG08_005842 [Elysia crispata]
MSVTSMSILTSLDVSNTEVNPYISRYPPVVTFTLNSEQTTFNEGEDLEFNCSNQGSPELYLTLTKNKTNEDLVSVQKGELIYTLRLRCIDTGVYVCSGQNSRATTKQKISISVLCHPRLKQSFTSKPIFYGVLGETALIDIEIYGYPEPKTLSLQKANNDTDLTSSLRHTVKYTAGVTPFGAVSVTISNILEADFTIYKVTIDNGVGDALLYHFSLNQIDNAGNSLPLGYIVGGAIAVVPIAAFTVVIIVVLRKKRFRNLSQDPQNLQHSDYLVPLEIFNQNIDYLAPAESDEYLNPIETSAIDDTASISASRPPGSRQDETDIEHPNDQQDLEGNHSSIGNPTSSEH